MRFVLAAVVLVATFGCATRREAAPSYAGTFTELTREVSALPPSARKDRIEDLLDRLGNEILSQQGPGGGSLSESAIENLTKLGEYMAPAKLELGFATESRDWTGDGVDDGIEVYLIPRDDSGSAIKTPGTMEAILLKESAIGLGITQKEMDRWTVPPDDITKRWNSSLFPGYILRLPWHNGIPDAPAAILTVTFEPLFGQSLTARKRIEIHNKPTIQPGTEAKASSKTAA